MGFNYDVAFSRNFGWLTKEEQQKLRGKTVAIAGMGGVGGIHLLTLARLGIANFHIADLDIFDIENFNRQVGANMNTIKRSKVEVMKEMALAINPEIKFKVFDKGVDKDNVEEFLTDVDIYVDGLDYFCFEARILVFNECNRLKIPATTAGPIGMGSVQLNFLPGKMSFNDYFGLHKENSTLDNAIKFGLGLSPKSRHFSYLVIKGTFALEDKKGPSTPMGCNMCAGAVGAEVLKILLERGKVFSAPHSFQTDAYLNKTYHSWMPMGYKNPIQKLRFFIIKNVILNKKGK